MFYCTLKNELAFTLSRRETIFYQEKFLVFEAQPVFSKLSEAAHLDERDRISFTSTPSLHYRTKGFILAENNRVILKKGTNKA